LNGDQGTGKSVICRIIIALIDPSRIDLQAFPSNPKDLTAVVKGAHVRCFDNMRSITAAMSDLLCMASTGGSSGTRALYSNSDLHVDQLHVALVLNSIHHLINQSDLAQRSLCLQTKAMPETSRKSEVAMSQDLEADLPIIFRGLLDLIADVFEHLPSVKVSSPERMLDFVFWLAAMEKVHGAPTGVYQDQYSSVLRQAQLDGLMDNLLASAILEFAEQEISPHPWSGSPTDLLAELEAKATTGTTRALDWPKNSIALSKRLNALKAGLLTQGIVVEFSRGKKRMITLKQILLPTI
jgi:hypothetical protein